VSLKETFHKYVSNSRVHEDGVNTEPISAEINRLVNKLQATEMEYWRISARKSRKEKVRNVTIREIMEVEKNILEVTEEKRLRWFGHVERMPGNRLPLKILE
jgi:hypothetical protein